LITLADWPVPAWSNTDSTVWQISYVAAFPTKCNVFIAPGNVKVINAGGIHMIAKAPRWDAYVINDKTKTICVVPYATWSARNSFIHTSDMELPSGKHSLEEPTTFLGIPAIHYGIKDKAVDGFWQDRRKSADCVAQYYGTNEIPMVGAQRNIIIAWLGFPKTKELPLFWGRTFADGSKSFQLRATAIAKQKSQATLFAIPTNYKNASLFDIFEAANVDLYNSIADFASHPTTTDKLHK
jgi:hypothetical protein